jgi:hypothetical protein
MTIFPSWELARSIFPLKPQLKSDMPMVNTSIMTVSGWAMPGFHTDIVESILAIATIL